MRDKVGPELRQRAATMRKNLIESERRLWSAQRHSLAPENTHFRRQVVVDRAIVDFACVKTQTIIEVDGDQHGYDRALSYDAKRTLALEAAGWRVLRFTIAQVVRELQSVVDTILAAMEGRS
jgi:very-short-patch-repair endonuclease